MQAFETLGARGQVGRLRSLADTALAAYGIRTARLVPLAHLENTTFRVEAAGGERYLLRIHRTIGSPFHPPLNVAQVRSETAWLSALRRDTGLAVPEPILTVGGEPVTVAEAPGVPEPRVCVLFRWSDGRFFDDGLTPAHLDRVGAFAARLHDHAAGFVPPTGFVRRQVEEVDGDAAAFAVGVVREVMGSKALATVERVLETVRRAKEQLGTGPAVFGLIHADLHQENYLFERGQVRAIDFDDCGWGHFAYDLAVTLSELRGRSDYDALRTGLLRGYRDQRPLPIDHERFIEVFHGFRLLQLLLWFLEQRHHPGFAGWKAEVDELLADLERPTNPHPSSVSVGPDSVLPFGR